MVDRGAPRRSLALVWTFGCRCGAQCILYLVPVNKRTRRERDREAGFCIDIRVFAWVFPELEACGRGFHVDARRALLDNERDYETFHVARHQRWLACLISGSTGSDPRWH